ncbi:MAG: hypothetical protein H7249_12865 [Chitinophagaceae bacterium]|nr:hypothetical protein [Oligoflexus sp.]
MNRVKISHVLVHVSCALLYTGCSDSTQFAEKTTPISLDAAKAASGVTSPDAATDGSTTADKTAAPGATVAATGTGPSAREPSVSGTAVTPTAGAGGGTNSVPTSSPGTGSTSHGTSTTGSTGSGTPVIPKCNPGEVGLTKVTLLSTGIEQFSDNQTLRYELSVVSCADGSVIPIKNQAVWFDLNAIATDGFQSSSYTIYDSSDKAYLASGDLKIVRGRDLFNHSGSSYAHWETATLSYSTDIEKLILEIDLNGNSFKPYTAGAATIASYLKVAGAQTVTQDLKITNR